jgi:hypothetical protein
MRKRAPASCNGYSESDLAPVLERIRAGRVTEPILGDVVPPPSSGAGRDGRHGARRLLGALRSRFAAECALISKEIRAPDGSATEETVPGKDAGANPRFAECPSGDHVRARRRGLAPWGRETPEGDFRRGRLHHRDVLSGISFRPPSPRCCKGSSRRDVPLTLREVDEPRCGGRSLAPGFPETSSSSGDACSRTASSPLCGAGAPAPPRGRTTASSRRRANRRAWDRCAVAYRRTRSGGEGRPEWRSPLPARASVLPARVRKTWRRALISRACTCRRPSAQGEREGEISAGGPGESAAALRSRVSSGKPGAEGTYPSRSTMDLGARLAGGLMGLLDGGALHGLHRPGGACRLCILENTPGRGRVSPLRRGGSCCIPPGSRTEAHFVGGRERRLRGGPRRGARYWRPCRRARPGELRVRCVLRGRARHDARRVRSATPLTAVWPAPPDADAAATVEPRRPGARPPSLSGVGDRGPSAGEADGDAGGPSGRAAAGASAGAGLERSGRALSEASFPSTGSGATSDSGGSRTGVVSQEDNEVPA